MNEGTANALEIHRLDVTYRVRGRERQVLRQVSFTVAPGESYGLVGESGCGKSTIALSIVRYLARNGRVSGGSILVDGRNLLTLKARELREMRLRSVSMVYQDPGKALNPSIRVGRQLSDVYALLGAGKAKAKEHAMEMLTKVQIGDLDSVMQRYPHQLSGGMQQRVVIAMALASSPRLLILDEPTTGLDATVEAEVLDLVRDLQAEFGTSVLFISHNLGLVDRMCDRVGILYAGTLIEEGPANDVFEDPRHPYTVGLMRCVPWAGMRKDHGRLDSIPGFLPTPGAELTGCVFSARCALADDGCRVSAPPLAQLSGGRLTRCYYHQKAQNLPRSTPAELTALTSVDRSASPLLRAEKISKTFRQGGNNVHALRDVSAELWPGETLGLVGESGSGKTSFARILLGLTHADDNSRIELHGQPVASTVRKRSLSQIRDLQIVFQNPDQALNQHHSVRRIIGRALTRLAGLRAKARDDRLVTLTRSVQLADRYLTVRPSSLSGGLKQRVAIARAFAGNPKIVVCDEPTSSLDVSVQAAILNLLGELQREDQTSYIFISHDLGVVRYLADRIAVLFLGRLMEIGPAETVFEGPHHPYTEALLSALPTLDSKNPRRIRLTGEIPSAANPPSGCVFHTRCHRKLPGGICESQDPPLHEHQDSHMVACHIPADALPRAHSRGK